jgi:hypothetical protein
MEFSAARQPTGYISRLQQRTLGWKVGSQIPRDSYEREAEVSFQSHRWR